MSQILSERSFSSFRYTGDDFSPKGNGCRSSDCQQRTHKNTTWPEIEEIWSGLFYKKALKFNYLKVASKL
ncbi:hypothetical protein DS957_029515 [Vibrio harveyi]|uniref:Uncharacterized protein n=1 Tax=Vibrio harveyi TaxID=669 RepID=A0A8B3DAW2_VIBHA|nr:hypothetical protein DS957_029515 [Vibrio harveyi]